MPLTKDFRNECEMKKLILLPTLLLVLMACKTQPPVPPDSETAAAVATLIVAKNLFGGDSSIAQQIYFIKVDKSRNLLGHKIITSTYKNDRNIYLLNAEPGTYAIVGYYVKQVQNNAGVQTTYNYYYVFDQKSIEKSKFELKSNETKILGQVRTGAGSSLTEGDAAQNHYGEILAPGASGWTGFGKNVLSAMFSGISTYRVPAQIEAIEYDQLVRTQILDGVIDDWSGTTWEGKEIRGDN